MKYSFFIVILLLFSISAKGQNLSRGGVTPQAISILCDYQALIDQGKTEAEKQIIEDHYLTLLGALELLKEYRQQFLAKGELIDLFPAAYYHTTLSEMLNIVQLDYDHPIEKMKQMMAFFDAYQVNRENWEAGNVMKVEAHWLKHFKEAVGSQNPLYEAFCLDIAYVLKSGIEAHVNYDLSRAIRYAYQNRYDQTLTEAELRKEFNDTDKIFANTNEKTRLDIHHSGRCNKYFQSVGQTIGVFLINDIIAYLFDEANVYTDSDVINMRKSAWQQAFNQTSTPGLDGKPLAKQPVSRHARLKLIARKFCGPGEPEDISLFLFDTSGSMSKNNRIGQARNSALATIRDLKNRDPRSSTKPIVAIDVFSGGCSAASTRQLLDFTDDLDLAEQRIRNNIPRPNGGTPLPQAMEVAEGQLGSYLKGRSFQSIGKIIVLSDGKSTCGPIRPANVFEFPLLNRSQPLAYNSTSSGITYYTVGLGLAPGSPAERDLKYLAAMSGGAYLNAQNQNQLTRAFEKFQRTYHPFSNQESKANAEAHFLFSQARNEMILGYYTLAENLFRAYVETYPNDWAAHYNLAMMLEANRKYHKAGKYYLETQALVTDSDQQRKLDSLVVKMNQDHQNFQKYQREIVISDFTYLKNYYESLFFEKNEALAVEFQGFVREKRTFYTNLPETLETSNQELLNEVEALVKGLDHVSQFVDQPDFDKSAVSFLAEPLTHMERVAELVQK